MIRWRLSIIPALAVGMLAGAFSIAAAAEEVRIAPVRATTELKNDYALRMEALEAELAAMRSQLAGYGGVAASPHHGGHGCVCNGCRRCCRSPGLYGGAEIVWINPHFEDESAFIIDGTFVNQLVLFDYDFEASPRFWLGYVGCSGLGARIRYWIYDDEAAASGVLDDRGEAIAFSQGDALRRRLVAGAGDAVSAQRELELQTLDLEATQLFERGSFLMLGSAGLRYARIEQDYRVQSTDPLGAQDELLHDHDFEGIGPTAALEIWRPLGGSQFSFYGAVRGSVLFGETDQQITEREGAQVFVDFREDVDEAVAIGELGLGLQWTATTVYNSILFVRGGWEGQYWSGAGNANTTSGDMALEGIALAVGLLR